MRRLNLDFVRLADMLANVLRAYDGADESQRLIGVTWYARRREECEAAAEELGIVPEVYAGALAALSPELDFDYNVRAVTELARDGTTRIGYPANIHKAARILNGEAPLAVLGGNKVRAFFECIADPAGTRAVCVDRHAAAAAGVDYYWVCGNSVGVYARVANAYRLAAELRGVRPCEVQAVVWIAYRENVLGFLRHVVDRRGRL